MQLSSCGLTSHLNFINDGDRITVNLQADIGFMRSSFHGTETRPQNISPSRARRRKRRRHKSTITARASTELNSQDFTNQNIVVCENEAVDNTETFNVDVEARALHDILPATSQNSDGVPACLDCTTSSLSSTIHNSDDVPAPCDPASLDCTTSSSSPTSQSVQESTSKKPISMNEFYSYMENFNASLGTILEEKLADVINGPS